MQTHSTVTSDLDSLSSLQHSRPKGMISLNRFLRRFGYDAAQLETLSRMPAGSARSNPFAIRLQRFMSLALEIVALRMLQEQDLDEAIAWFRSRGLDTFDGCTPEAIVAAGGGPALVHALSAHAALH